METLLRKYVVAWAGVVGSDCWVGSIGKPGAEADVTEYDDLEDDDHEVTMDDLEEDEELTLEKLEKGNGWEALRVIAIGACICWYWVLVSTSSYNMVVLGIYK